MFVLPYLISRWSKVWCNNHVRRRGIFIGLTILCLSDTTTINFSCNLVEKKSIFKSWPTLSSSRLAGSKNLSPRSSFFTLRLANFNHIKKSKNLFKITKNELKIHKFLFATTLRFWGFVCFPFSRPARRVSLILKYATNFCRWNVLRPIASQTVFSENSNDHRKHQRVSGSQKTAFLRCSLEQQFSTISQSNDNTCLMHASPTLKISLKMFP